jgi:molybdate transport system ATP-binding protein
MANPRTPAEEPTNPTAPVSQSEARLRCNFRKLLRTNAQDFLLEVTFEVAPGFTILFGASGSGKTTLLDCIAGITTPESGKISIGECTLFDSAQGSNVPIARRRAGYVLQDLALFPHMTVAQNVAYGLAHLSETDRNQTVTSMLQAFRIAHLAQRKAREISGGEAQRVALARTLVTEPAVLLLDEPLAALDSPTKSQIIEDLRKWNQDHRIPVLYVTHSRDEVFSLGERIILIESGHVVAQGTPHEVMMAPLQDSVAQLVGFENAFDCVVDAVRPERGTMTCRIAGDAGPLLLETPLVAGGVGAPLRVGIRAGDILLATSPPVGLSARNVIPGRIKSIEQRDVIVSAHVKCAVELEVHLTLAARDSLQLAKGREVWLVIKTHSCHLMQRPADRPSSR